MKWLYILMILLSAQAVLANDLIITEILYDPIAAESDGEAVEIYNPTNSTINLQSYYIQTESFKNYTLPDFSLEPDTCFLIADAGWAAGKDNETFPNADYEVEISLTNSDFGIRLMSEEVIDAVGWGNPDAGFYEGAPASHVQSGYSLRRIQDTQDNSADFVESYPDFKNSTKEQQEEGAEITITANISNSQPLITSVFLMEDDLESEGVQLLPYPGTQRILTITAEIEDTDGENDIGQVTVSIPELNITQALEKVSNSTYQAGLQMEYYFSPGNYTVGLEVRDKANETSSASEQFEYLEIASISVDAQELSFMDLIKGAFSAILGDRDTGTESPTLKNTGNSNLNLGIYGGNLLSGENSIAVSNLEYSFDNNFNSTLSGTVSDLLQIVPVNLLYGADALNEFALRLFVPEGTPKGDYEGKVSVVGVAQ